MKTEVKMMGGIETLVITEDMLDANTHEIIQVPQDIIDSMKARLAESTFEKNVKRRAEGRKNVLTSVKACVEYARGKNVAISKIGDDFVHVVANESQEFELDIDCANRVQRISGYHPNMLLAIIPRLTLDERIAIRKNY